jgi:uncharacterized protein (TIGR03435 family)
MKKSSAMSFALWFAGMLFPHAMVGQQPAFAVASIRPSAAEVKFEHDGSTETTPDTLHMQDVSVETCIKWAYGVQESQISGPDWIDSDKFDIIAKADGPATEPQMKLMLQALLADRFKLAFHHQDKELKAFVLTIAKGGAKVTPAAAPDARSFHQNSANGSVVKSMTIREWGDYISQPLHMPVVDRTGLTGKYDFVLDFTAYLPDAHNMGPDRPDATSILMAAMEGELGIKMQATKTQVDVMVIDHIEKPSAN